MKQWTVKWSMDTKKQPRAKPRSVGNERKVSMDAPILGSARLGAGSHVEKGSYCPEGICGLWTRRKYVTSCWAFE